MSEHPPTGGDWDGEAVNHAIDNLPNAEEALNRILRACENPNSFVRVRFGDRPWSLLRGPDLLAQLEHEQRDPFTIDSVVIR